MKIKIIDVTIFQPKEESKPEKKPSVKKKSKTEPTPTDEVIFSRKIIIKWFSFEIIFT